jgi:TonB family protein
MTIGKTFLDQVVVYSLSNASSRSSSIASWICLQPPPRTLIVTPVPATAGVRTSIKKHGAWIDVVQMPTQSNNLLKSGWVDAGFCIDAKGHIANATIEASSPRGLYDSVALDALKTWKFTARKSWGFVKTCGLHYHIPIIGAASLARSPIVVNQRPTAIQTQDLALPVRKATPLNGRVTLRLCIDQDGSVSNARVISSRPGRIFTRAALRTLHVWQYWPRTVSGKPQRTCNVRETVIFRLGHQHLVWVYPSTS